MLPPPPSVRAVGSAAGRAGAGAVETRDPSRVGSGYGYPGRPHATLMRARETRRDSVGDRVVPTATVRFSLRVMPVCFTGATLSVLPSQPGARPEARGQLGRDPTLLAAIFTGSASFYSQCLIFPRGPAEASALRRPECLADPPTGEVGEGRRQGRGYV